MPKNAIRAPVGLVSLKPTPHVKMTSVQNGHPLAAQVVVDFCVSASAITADVAVSYDLSLKIG